MYAPMGVTVDHTWKAGRAASVQPRYARHRQLLLPNQYRRDLAIGNANLADGVRCSSIARDDGRVGDNQIQIGALSSS